MSLIERHFCLVFSMAVEKALTVIENTRLMSTGECQHGLGVRPLCMTPFAIRALKARE